MNNVRLGDDRSLSFMTELVYFAYGSNMSSKRLQRRVFSVVAIGTAILDGHALAFHKVSDKDGSGKCDIVESKSEQVHGVLYRVRKVEKKVLDLVEGLGYGYSEKMVTVIDTTGTRLSAFTYFATIIDPNLNPFTWYLQHVIEGALEARLPQHYLEKLHQVKAILDHDAQRELRELAIYN